MFTRPTLWHHKGDCVSANQFAYYLKKCYHNLHVTTKPRIHATNNTTLFDVLFIYNDSVINQSLQIEIGIQYTDSISKILRNYSQKFKEDASTMLKK